MWYYLLYIVSLGSYVLWLINLGEIHSSVLCYINRKLLNDKIEHICSVIGCRKVFIFSVSYCKLRAS